MFIATLTCVKSVGETDAHAEIRQCVTQGAGRRMKGLHGGGTLRLQIESHAVAVGEVCQRALIIGRQCGEIAQYKDFVARPVIRVVTDRELDLLQAIAQRQAADQLTQRRQQRRNMRRQHRAAAHVGDEAGLPLVEADQYPTLFGHVAHRQPRPLPVAPCRSGASSLARTHRWCQSASSSTRCLAATCAVPRCCRLQPPQTPKCGQAAHA
jgi:hypothetical protein